MKEAEITPEKIEATYYLTAIAGFDERFVIPPFSREAAIGLVQITQAPHGWDPHPEMDRRLPWDECECSGAESLEREPRWS